MVDDASHSSLPRHVLEWSPPVAGTTGAETAAAAARGGPDPAARVPDGVLLARCREGDADAWDAVVARHETLVYSVACEAGLPAGEAADVTQATFLALLSGLSTLRAEDRLAGWLITVAMRHARRARTRLDREDAAGLHVALPMSDVEQELEWQRVVEVRDAVERLDPRCRRLVDALYFDPEHPPYTVVARRMGYAVGTLGPMRARCLARLRHLLGEDD